MPTSTSTPTVARCAQHRWGRPSVFLRGFHACKVCGEIERPYDRGNHFWIPWDNWQARCAICGVKVSVKHTRRARLWQFYDGADVLRGCLLIHRDPGTSFWGNLFFRPRHLLPSVPYCRIGIQQPMGFEASWRLWVTWIKGQGWSWELDRFSSGQTILYRINLHPPADIPPCVAQEVP